MSVPRQAADASNRTMRSSKVPRLLKQVGGKTTSSSPAPSTSGSHHGASRRSPSTDAPPESSEDEAAPATTTQEETPRPIKKYDEKLKLLRDAERQVEEGLKAEVSSSRLREIEQQPTQSASAGSSMSKRDLGEEDEPDWISSQQPQKKKRMTYTKVPNIHVSKKSQSSHPDPPPPPQEKSSGPSFKIPKGSEWEDDEDRARPASGFKPLNLETGLDSTSQGQDGGNSPGFHSPPELNMSEADTNSGASTPTFKKPRLADIDISTDKALKSQLEGLQSNFRHPPDVKTDLFLVQKQKKRFIVPTTFTQMASNDPVPSSFISAPASASPAIFDDHETHYSSSSSLSSPRSAILTPREQEDFDADMAANTLAKCPMCGQPVKQALLEQWMAKKKTAVRYQRQFCKSHRKLDAEKTWRQRGYPNIDWSTFDSRIKAHFPRLERVLQNKESSFYRNALASSIKTGADRTLRQTIMGSGGDRLSAGYYGPKGSLRMTTAIITRFAPLLRRLSTTDPLLSKGGGVPQFVQMVMVPELTVLLVKKDMSVDDDGARVIIAESEEMGVDLNGDDDADAADVEHVLREAELAKEQQEARRDLRLYE